MHLVITTREDPNLPLARLRVRRQLTELRIADLRFTPAETAEFLNKAIGLTLSIENISALEARTEGWIAGLQLAALSMQGIRISPDLFRHSQETTDISWIILSKKFYSVSPNRFETSYSKRPSLTA